MFEALVAAALISVVDPVGDVVGAGSLQPPTAAVYRNLAPFDIRQVTVTDDPQLTVVIEMGSLANPFDLPLGFSLPVIDVYLEGEQGAGEEPLTGPGLRLPNGRTWEVALRLTGEGAMAYRATEAEIESATARVAVDGNNLIVYTPFSQPERTRIYAAVGLFDLFGSSPWRPLAPSESPWAFWGADSQQVPVVDVLARDAAAQRQSLESGVLLPAGARQRVDGAFWIVLMGLGLFVALLGIAVRTASRRSAPKEHLGPEVPSPATADSREEAAEERAFPGRPAAGDARVAADFDEREGALTDDQEQVNEPEARAPGRFTWDSSALLTEALDDDEFSQDFTSGRTEGSRSAWNRPVPLPIESEDPGAGADQSGNRDEVDRAKVGEGEVDDGEVELLIDEAEDRLEPSLREEDAKGGAHEPLPDDEEVNEERREE